MALDDKLILEMSKIAGMYDVVSNYVDSLVKNENLLDLGIFSRKSIKNVVQQHISGERNHSKNIHSLISISLWLKNHS